jgi:hypothetical protein
VGAAIKESKPTDIGAFVRELRLAAVEERLLHIRPESYHGN